MKLPLSLISTILQNLQQQQLPLSLISVAPPYPPQLQQQTHHRLCMSGEKMTQRGHSPCLVIIKRMPWTLAWGLRGPGTSSHPPRPVKRTAAWQPRGRDTSRQRVCYQRGTFKVGPRFGKHRRHTCITKVL